MQPPQEGAQPLQPLGRSCCHFMVQPPRFTSVLALASLTGTSHASWQGHSARMPALPALPSQPLVAFGSTCRLAFLELNSNKLSEAWHLEETSCLSRKNSVAKGQAHESQSPLRLL